MTVVEPYPFLVRIVFHTTKKVATDMHDISVSQVDVKTISYSVVPDGIGSILFVFVPVPRLGSSQ